MSVTRPTIAALALLCWLLTLCRRDLRPVAVGLSALAALDWLALLTRDHPRLDLVPYAAWSGTVAALCAATVARRRWWWAFGAFLAYGLALCLAYPILGTLYVPALKALPISLSAVAGWSYFTRRSPLDLPAVVALTLAAGEVVDLLGGWLAGDPWRDHAITQWVTMATYGVVAVEMTVGALSRPRA